MPLAVYDSELRRISVPRTWVNKGHEDHDHHRGFGLSCRNSEGGRPGVSAARTSQASAREGHGQWKDRRTGQGVVGDCTESPHQANPKGPGTPEVEMLIANLVVKYAAHVPTDAVSVIAVTMPRRELERSAANDERR